MGCPLQPELEVIVPSSSANGRIIHGLGVAICVPDWADGGNRVKQKRLGFELNSGMWFVKMRAAREISPELQTISH